MIIGEGLDSYLVGRTTVVPKRPDMRMELFYHPLASVCDTGCRLLCNRAEENSDIQKRKG